MLLTVCVWTHLKPGEGLVGLIALQAEPMQSPDAQHHPAFSTGLGVPIQPARSIARHRR